MKIEVLANRNYRVVLLLIALGAIGAVLYSMSVSKHEAEIAASAPESVRRSDGNTTEVQIATAEIASEPTFVGREVCKECHAENYQLHSLHGHASTFFDASDPQISSKFVGRTYDQDQRYGTFTYHTDQQGLVARIPEQFGDQSFPLQYALGSGHNGFTLLSLIPDPKLGTVGIEHRVSWYRKGDLLGSTPGQRHHPPETRAELFGERHEDKVMEKCVDCHTTTGRIENQEIVDLTPNVNCEKCHGPASEHVRQARLTRTPPHFSVGRDDWDTESELQLCGDCHRLPTVMSRKQLREYPDHLARFQPIGLLRSKCYLQSDGKLKCTTCHNPHATVRGTSAAQHVQSCLKCHSEQSPSHVTCPVSPKQGCIECHMPPLELDFNIGFHDHWIRVRADE